MRTLAWNFEYEQNQMGQRVSKFERIERKRKGCCKPSQGPNDPASLEIETVLAGGECRRGYGKTPYPFECQRGRYPSELAKNAEAQKTQG